MKSFILSILRGVKMLDFIGKSDVSLRVFIFLFLLFQLQFLSGQNRINDSSAIISVSSGSIIYSSDKNFNQQIRLGRVILNESSVSDKNAQGRNYLVIVSKQISKFNHADLASQLKEAKTKKKSEDLKKIRQQIASYEAKKDQFIKDSIGNYPPSGSFSKTQYAAKHCVSERSHQDDHNKFVTEEHKCPLLRALDYLHSQKYFAYNTKSFDYCYSKFFSVRPPPSIV